MSFFLKDPGSEVGGPKRAERILSDLRDRVRTRLPDLAARGPEDPIWTILEAFAEALDDARSEAERLEDRLEPRILELLGEEPRWAAAAAGAVALVPHEGLTEPILVPRGTALMAARRSGEAGAVFETTQDCWCGSARLSRLVGAAGDDVAELFPFPQSGWDSGPVRLFAEALRIARHLYLGDPIFHALRDRAGELVLESPGVPAVVAEGVWEVSVRGGWRALRVELEESRSSRGRRTLRTRIPGPIPDLVETSVEGAASPWIRLVLPGDRRIVLPQPAWVSLDTGTGPGLPRSRGADLALPRPVLRVFTQAGERWEDHSLSAKKIAAADSSESADPAVWLGWDAPSAASVHWRLERPAVPDGWDDARAPRLVWEHTSGRGFRPLDVDDGTRGLTRTGGTSWTLPSDWTPQEHFGERLYWVRARWVAGAYASPPTVRAVIPHGVGIVGGRTLANPVLEVQLDELGRGEIDLSFPEGHPDRFDVVEARTEDGRWERLVGGSPPGEAPQGPGGTFEVRRSPRGCYSLRLPSGWQGHLKLRLPHLRVGLGARGNLPRDTIRVLAADIEGVRTVFQPLPTAGGMDPETPEDFRRRLVAEWGTGRRAVSAPDVRALSRSLDPEIARVEVAADPETCGRIFVSLVPIEPHVPGRFPPERLAWIQASLQDRVPLGTAVEVVEATYLPFEVWARQAEPGPLPSETTRRRLESRLRAHLDPLRGGEDGRGFTAGKVLQASGLSAIISAFFLDAGGRGGTRRGASAALNTETDLTAARTRLPGDLSPGDWDPRTWRFECVVPDGVPGVLDDPMPVLVLPVLERMVFEPYERSPIR